MRAIIVDDEVLMVRKFIRMTEDIADLNFVGSFTNPEEALLFARDNQIDVAFLDIEMPGMNGIDLARHLRELRGDVIIVFVTAYESYVHESNVLGADYYLLKPYSKAMLLNMMDNIRLIAQRQSKDVYIQTFGRFLVKKNGRPIALTGKAKEILALVVTKRGKEISNEEIYRTLWEGRPYDNDSMSVYYNAVRRLRKSLEKEGLEGLLVSTSRGQMVDTSLFDCDYYAWKDNRKDNRSTFEGEFLSEYSWGEYLIGELLDEHFAEER